MNSDLLGRCFGLSMVRELEATHGPVSDICLGTLALEHKAALVKVTAKLNAVSTLYTEAAQREAVLRLELEQSANAAKEALYD